MAIEQDRHEELTHVINQLASLSDQEKRFICDLPDHFRRMALHFGTISTLLTFLNKSIAQSGWEKKEEMLALIERLQRENNPRQGIISRAAYEETVYASLHQESKKEDQAQEKLTFDLYARLSRLLKSKPHHPIVQAKLNAISQRLIKAMREEKIIQSVDVHLDSLVQNFQNLLALFSERLEDEQKILHELQQFLRTPFSESPDLQLLQDRMKKSLLYGRQLQVRLNEEFYKLFQKFTDEKMVAEDRVKHLLHAKKTLFHLGVSPKITRQDFILDYYTLTSPEDVLEYIEAIDLLGPEFVDSGLQKFIRQNRRRLLQRVRLQKHGLLRELALMGKDSLTGVATKRVFQEKLNEYVASALRSRQPFSLLMLDIDYFKSINDSLGHLIGDHVLRNVAQSLSKGIRRYDLLARYGGEEFIILLPSTIKENALAIAEKIRLRVAAENTNPPHPKTGGPITISIGVSTFPQDAQDGTTLIQKADTALYAAKQGGRNKVVAA